MKQVQSVLFSLLCLNLSASYSSEQGFKPSVQGDVLDSVAAVIPAMNKLPLDKPAPAKKKSFRVSSAPPPGFEALAEPETTLIDIYYGGRPIATTLATFTPSEIELLEPDSILKLIPGIIHSAEVQIALTGSQPHNAENICPTEPYPGCGLLEPEVANILFDIGQFRAYLFIHPDYLERRSSLEQKFLPSSHAGSGFIQLFNLSVSGAVQESVSYGLTGNTWFSYGQNHVSALWYVNDKQGFQLRTLSATHDSQSTRYRLGMLRTHGSRLINEQEFIGLGVASNMDMRTDLDQGSSSLLQIYLPMRSQVDIYKKDQLLDSGFYESGHQIINTNKLPNGAYDVILKIQDHLGNVREETLFFSRIADLPPADQPLYYAEAGLLKASVQTSKIWPQYGGNWLIHMGTQHRITDTLGLEAAVLANKDEIILESNASFVSEYTRTSGAVMATSRQDYAAGLQSRFHYKQLNGGLSYRQVWRNSELSKNSPFLPAQESSTQLSASLNYYLPYASLSLRTNWRQRGQGESSWTVNPGVRIPLFKHRGVQLDFKVGYIHSANKSEVLGQLNLSGWSGRWSNRTQFGSHTVITPRSDSHTEISGNTSLNWSDQDLIPEDLSVRLNAHYRGGQSTFGAGIHYRDDKTDIQLGAEQQLDRSGQAIQTSYGGNLSYGFASDMKHFVAGSPQSAQSGVIIELGGSAKTGTFEATVNGQSRGLIKASSRTLVLLPPYKTYKIKLSPVNTSFTDFDVSERETTLYPGNIVTLSWQVNQVYVIIVRILYPDGTPVAKARVRGVVGVAAIDEGGLLQTEVDATARELQVTPLNHPPCTVQLPELNTHEDIIILDDLVCN